MIRTSIFAAHRARGLTGLSLLALIAALSPAAALAQGSSGAALEAGSNADIVVTARRRDESLAKVPIAITAIGAEDLVKRAITTDADLQRTVPGLTIRQTQGNNSLTYSLRGQSADIFSGSPSAVVTYLNEVPIPVGGASTFFDLQSVQALKGPQGTLFGRNATGGAVLFTSAQPTNDLGGYARARYGRFDHVEVEGAINLPIVDDRVLLRVAGNYTHDDGFIRNLYTGDTLGQINRGNARATLTLKPTDTITSTTMLQYSKTTGTNTGASYTYSVYAPGETNNGNALNAAAGGLFGPNGAFGSAFWAGYLATHPKAYAPGLLAYVDEQRRLGPYVTNHPGGARHYGESWTLTNITEIALGDSLKLRNIFGFVDSFTLSDQPQLGAPFVTILTENAQRGLYGNLDKLRSYSEEIQLQGQAGALDFIVGAYFQRQTVRSQYPQTYFDLGAPAFGTPAYANNHFRIRNNTNAVYAQGTYDLSSIGAEGLKLTAGIRYTWERVKGFQLRGSDNFGAPERVRDYSDPSWEVGLQYQATPDLLLYVKTRGSFRSGGYNGTFDPTVQNLNASNFFGSETTEDVEGGLKYSGRVMGRRATLNIAVFNQWIHGVQRAEFPDPDGPGGVASIAYTTNVPEERVRGIEAEAMVQPADWLRVGGQLAVTDAKFTNGTVVLFGKSYSYGPVGDTPKSSGTLWAELSAPMDAAVGQVSLRGEVYSQTGQYFSNAADTIAPRTRLPGYTLVNGRLSWNGIMGSPVSAALYGENLFDQEYFVGGMQLASALGHNGAVVGKPRTYGVELSFKF
ncbi:TonB-dependent receptor [Sphingobium sufflavum]|uniref:TonB-dependent receptor n=1 Tax=Sphingobium sufflavum TaxID=1129547 RepID=UPI001F23644C|nr:TonB-dependent receptor [Sphingobium sufflavum]MCE7796639.1 TonB-dependent receptor [Sphingobium sufflavum]